MSNEVAEALQSLTPLLGGQIPRVIRLFQDKPEVLDAIIEARTRRCSYAQIAKAISTPEQRVSDSAVRTFLISRGFD